MKSYTYTKSVLTASLMFSSIPFLTAQEAKPTGTSEPVKVTAEELASRKTSIHLIEERIKDREQQITIIVKDIERINTHMEDRIDKVVNTLTKMKDSQDSKTRVAHMKEDLMKGLYKTIENYNRRRAELKEQLRTGKADIGTKSANSGVEFFDSKIEKRASQLVELSKSFTEHVDYKKYENDSSGGDYGYGGRHGWGWSHTRTSEKWKQNRRESTVTDDQRKKITRALKISIEDLERRNNTLRNKFKESGVSEETQKFYQQDIARNETTIATRKNQISELIDPSKGKAATTSVSGNKAHDTELLIREIANDIRKNSNDITRNYNELKKRLASLNRTKINLEARKEWLKKYETTNGAPTE